MPDFVTLEDAIEIVMTMARITSKTKEETIACDVVEDFFVNNYSDEYKFTFPNQKVGAKELKTGD